MRWIGRRPRRAPSAVQAANGLIERVTATQLPRSAGSWRIAVMGPKGGSGKTPTAATLGQNLAGLRGEITAVIDANPHMGTLRRRLVPEGIEAPLPWLEMAALAAAGQLPPEWPVLSRFSDRVGRLRVFANTGIDPKLVEDMTGEQYTAGITLLSRAAEVVISDLGTSTTGPVAVAALDAADQLVLCTKMSLDTLQVALEWLSALCGEPVSYRPTPEDYSSIADGRYAELARRAIIVVAPGGGEPAALARLLDWFAQVTNVGRDSGRVVVVPQDPHIGRGERILLDQLQPPTRLEYLRVAGHVVDNFVLGPLGTRRQPPAPAVLPQLAVETARPLAPRVDERDRDTGIPAVRVPARPDWSSPVGRPRTATAASVPEADERVARPARAPSPGATVLAAAALSTPPRPVIGGAVEAAVDRPVVQAIAPAGVAGAAYLALSRDLAGVLGVEHTEGEVCTGCAVRGCSWPVPPPTGAGERA